MMMIPNSTDTSARQSHQRQPHQRRFGELEAALLIGCQQSTELLLLLTVSPVPPVCRHYG
jgi:hypothetical protein